MSDSGWNILLVEDDPDDFFLTNILLSQSRAAKFNLKWVFEIAAALQMIGSGQFDVALVDYNLGSGSGLDLIRQSNEKCQHTPFILLSGKGSYDIDLAAMQAGASDFLSKTEITGPILERSIRYAIEHGHALMEMRRIYEKVEMIADENIEEMLKSRRKIVDSLEYDSQQILHEIHAGPIRDLLGLNLICLEKANEGFGKDLLTDIQETINRTVINLRKTCNTLQNSTHKPFNLEEAVRSYAIEFRQKHPEVEVIVKSKPGPGAIPEPARLALYHIYLQAISNITYHARARHVEITLLQSREKAILEVRDDGQGFIIPGCLSDLALNGQVGLSSSADRAAAVGGELQIESAPGKGTKVRAIVPARMETA